MRVHTGPLLDLVQVPLMASRPQGVSTAPLGLVPSAVFGIDEDIKQYWSQYGPLRDTTCH